MPRATDKQTLLFFLQNNTYAIINQIKQKKKKKKPSIIESFLYYKLVLCMNFEKGWDIKKTKTAWDVCLLIFSYLIG